VPCRLSGKAGSGRLGKVLNFKVFKRTLFALTKRPLVEYGFGMTTRKSRWCWRKDLAEFRGLTDWERSGFLLVLEWFVA
jgi:hypothetical protein